MRCDPTTTGAEAGVLAARHELDLAVGANCSRERFGSTGLSMAASVTGQATRLRTDDLLWRIDPPWVALTAVTLGAALGADNQVPRSLFVSVLSAQPVFPPATVLPCDLVVAPTPLTGDVTVLRHAPIVAGCRAVTPQAAAACAS